MAAVRRVIDGDGLELDIDLGFRVWQRASCRLLGINAPEMSTKQGVAAKAALTSLVLGKQLEIKTTRDRRDKYGRMLVTVFLEDGVTTVNQWLLDQGLAVPYNP